MKQSNLALRGEFEEVEIAAPAPDTPQVDDTPRAPATHHLARTRAMGMNYRAIAIADDGLRPFRVR